MKKMVNGVEVEMTQQEIDEFNAMQASLASDVNFMTQNYKLALEELITNTANEKSYSSAVSCASYKDSTNAQWAAEATIFIQWRDNAYMYAYEYLAKVQSGEIQNPNINDFISGVPTIQWPDPPQPAEE